MFAVCVFVGLMHTLQDSITYLQKAYTYTCVCVYIYIDTIDVDTYLQNFYIEHNSASTYTDFCRTPFGRMQKSTYFRSSPVGSQAFFRTTIDHLQTFCRLSIIDCSCRCSSTSVIGGSRGRSLRRRQQATAAGGRQQVAGRRQQVAGRRMQAPGSKQQEAGGRRRHQWQQRCECYPFSIR